MLKFHQKKMIFWKSQSKMKHLIQIIMTIVVISQSNNLPLNYRYFSTTNYRIGPSAPINSQPANLWAIGNSNLPSEWTFISSSIDLYYAGTGSNGISIDYNVLENGVYTIQIILDTNNALQSNLNFWFNSSINTVTKITKMNTIQIVQNFTIGPGSIYFWVENSIEVNAVYMFPTVRKITVSVNLVHYPATNTLLLVTNISNANVYNASYLSQSKVLLQYLQNLGAGCIDSIGSKTNPADFANYNNQTNFTFLSNNYTISVVPSSSPLLNNVSPGFLVLSVSPILVDCTVNVNVSFVDGLLFNPSYHISIIPVINQTVTYIQDYIQSNVDVVWNIYVQPQKSAVFIRLGSAYISDFWDMYAVSLLSSMSINNINYYVNTNGGFTYRQTERLAIVCFYYNASLVVNAPPYNFYLPNKYFRNQQTNKILALTYVYNEPIPQGYINQTFIKVTNITYFVVEKTLRVRFNLSMNPEWEAQINGNFISIFVNDILLNNIQLVTNLQRFVQAQAFFANFNSSCIVKASVNGRWILNNNIGYHYQWLTYQIYPTPVFINATNLSINFSQAINQSPNIQVINNENFTLSFQINKQFIFQAVKVIKYYTKSLQFSLFSYFINSLINFQTLTFMYEFLAFRSSYNANRRQLAEAVLIVSNEVSYSTILSKITQQNIDFSFSKTSLDKLAGLPHSASSSTDNSSSVSASGSNNTSSMMVLQFNDYGYYSDFLRNNNDGLFSVLQTVLKLLLVKLLTRLPFLFAKRGLGNILTFWDELLLLEVVIMAPTLTLVLGVYLANSEMFGCSSLTETISNALLISVSFASFLFMIFKHYVRTKRYCHLQNGVFRIHIYHCRRKKFIQLTRLLNNSMYFIIPTLIGINNPSLFNMIIFPFSLHKLASMFFKRKYFSRFQLVRSFVLNVVWLLFNCIYMIYWLSDVFEADCTQGYWLHVMCICDFAQVCLFLLGCFLQMLCTLIQIVRDLVRFFRQKFFIELQKKIGQKDCKFGQKLMKINTKKILIQPKNNNQDTIQKQNMTKSHQNNFDKIKNETRKNLTKLKNQKVQTTNNNNVNFKKDKGKSKKMQKIANITAQRKSNLKQ